MIPRRNRAKRFKLILVTLAASLVCLASSLSPYGAGNAQEPAKPKGILALYWGGRENPSNAAFDKSVKEALGSASSIEYYPEDLQDNLFSEESMRDTLRQKLGDNRIGAIIAPSRRELNFLLKFRGELFTKTPIVFHASTSADLEKKDAANGVAVMIDHPYRNTIDLALKLHPDTNEVLVIAGTQEHDMKIEADVQKEIKEFEDRGVKFISLSDLSLDPLIAKVKNAPAHSIILYVRYSQEELGKTLDPYNSLTLITEAARVPVYTVSESILGRGSVGGRTATIEDCGRVMGETAARI